MNLLDNQLLMNENDLKSVLKGYKNGQKSWDKENQDLVVKSMVNHIGSTNSELRELIYSSFCQLVIENHLKHDLLNELMDFCLSDLLLKGIGENGTDSVFTRSFTTLLIDVILYKDNLDNFLSPSTINKVKEAIIHYINSEQDLRGYVPEKGWAHSAAHVADACVELVKNEKMEQIDYSKLVNALWKLILHSKSVYIHNEDDRIVKPILTMLNRGLDVEEIHSFINEMPKELKSQKEQIDYEDYLFLEANCRSFLKSLYIAIDSDYLLSLQTSIKKCLSEI